MKDSKTMRVDELADLLDINLTAAYELAKRPGFPSLRIGKRIVILRDSLDKWLEEEALKDKSRLA